MEIIFTIQDGTIQHEVVGAEGKECLKATEPYENALSTKKPDRKFKPELRQTTIKTSQQNQQKI